MQMMIQMQENIQTQKYTSFFLLLTSFSKSSAQTATSVFTMRIFRLSHPRPLHTQLVKLKLLSDNTTNEMPPRPASLQHNNLLKIARYLHEH